jgi:hypothetical protein
MPNSIVQLDNVVKVSAIQVFAFEVQRPNARIGHLTSTAIPIR